MALATLSKLSSWSKCRQLSKAWLEFFYWSPRSYFGVLLKLRLARSLERFFTPTTILVGVKSLATLMCRMHCHSPKWLVWPQRYHFASKPHSLRSHCYRGVAKGGDATSSLLIRTDNHQVHGLASVLHLSSSKSSS
jgi:hypothetical protein